MAYHQKLDTVSVVIPTLNRSCLLKRAISSVLMQTVEPDEIIVVANLHDNDILSALLELTPELTLELNHLRADSG